MTGLVRALAVATLLGTTAPRAAAGSPIDPALAEAVAAAGPGARVRLILALARTTDSRPLPAPRAARRAALVGALRDEHAAAAEQVRPALDRLGVGPGIPLWIVNALATEAPAAVVPELSLVPGVAGVRLDARVQAPPPSEPAAAGAPEWNVAAVRAPELWALGHRGAGATVAILDTGVDAAHADLAGRWRGGAADWFDPYGEHPVPHDASGHGTGVAALAVGGAAGGTAIGVAPDALWIAAKIFNDAGVGTLSGIHLAFQWALDPDGLPATDDAPDVMNGSFGFPELAGTCFREFEPDIAVLRSAGIAAVFSAGNSGPGDRTGVSPADNAGALAVGAVDEALAVARFSSRGPSMCDGGLFPRLVAPGVRVRTADLTAGGLFPARYVSRDGTSFAAPHVSGLLALLAAARPAATLPQLEDALASTALDVGDPGPDQGAGYGLPDAVRAWRVLGGLPPCPDDDADGYFPWTACGTPVDCDDADPSVHPGVQEVPLDGIDQDCNGYDLTIRILRAEYLAARRLLRVRAASALGRRAALVVQGYGPMTWNARRRRWTIRVGRVRHDPGAVLVTGREGARTAFTVAR